MLADIYNDATSVIRWNSIRYDTDPVASPRDFKTYWGRHWFEGSREEIDELWHDVSSSKKANLSRR